jgi:hypothetical protein|tara:strand:- start:163 stop:1356 length:1194 start_codon:yes stop_codon:yes gene_type:complete
MSILGTAKTLFKTKLTKLVGNLLYKNNMPGFGGKVVGRDNWPGPLEQGAKYNPKFGDKAVHDEYMFQSHQYPQGVGNTDEGHYMAFMIIERKKSTFKNEGFRTTISNIDIDAANPSAYEGTRKITDRAKLADKSIFVPRGIQSGFRSKTATSKEILTNMIFLYTPAGIATNYGVEYAAEATGMFGLMKSGVGKIAGGLAEGAGDFARDFKSGGLIGALQGSTMKEIMEDTANVGGTAFRAIVEGIVGEGMKAASQASTSTMVNPHMELMMSAPSFRNFAFSYTFAPRNQKELDSTHKIIKTFKYHMLPQMREPGGTEHLLDLPSQFEIRYMFMHKENMYLPFISRCYCDSVDVNYTPNDKFTTFKGDGAGASPNIIKMDLKFQELEIMTKDTIALGY